MQECHFYLALALEPTAAYPSDGYECCLLHIIPPADRSAGGTLNGCWAVYWYWTKAALGELQEVSMELRVLYEM